MSLLGPTYSLATRRASVQRCISGALADAGIRPEQVDAINGHLTATGADPREVDSWAKALRRKPGTLPPITATHGKSRRDPASVFKDGRRGFTGE